MQATIAGLFFIIGINLFAQETPITGRVLDGETLEALPFTNIVIEGKKTGTVSNIEGYYVLDRSGIDANNQIVFSYMGYESVTLSIEELHGNSIVMLKPAILNLQAVSVFSEMLTANDIIQRVKKNYTQNYPNPTQKRKVFLHTYENTPWQKSNQLKVKQSDFVGLDIRTFEEIFKELPANFTEYKDAIVEFYNHQKTSKILPIEGISMEEGSMKELSQFMESKLSDFLDDIQKTVQDEDVYYKFRSGIFAVKADYQSDADSTLEAFKYDSAHYFVHSGQLRYQIQFLLKNYASLDGDNWEFIDKPGKYTYSLEETTVYDNELVYKISFAPTKSGLFEGLLYVSTASYAILQMEFAYAEGKQNELINMLGVSHAMKYKKGRVIFEKGENGYFVKYINANQKEYAHIDRSFSVMKKEKRFLMDKELNTIQMDARLSFDMDTYWELLVIDQSEIDEKLFVEVKQPKFMKFKREYVYTPDMWQNGTVIAPVAELKTYKRSD
jgi:hypothetical protein